MGAAVHDVAHDFRGHHDNIALCVQGGVTSLQTRPLAPKHAAELIKLLITQRFQWCGVYDPLVPVAQRAWATQ